MIHVATTVTTEIGWVLNAEETTSVTMAGADGLARKTPKAIARRYDAAVDINTRSISDSTSILDYKLPLARSWLRRDHSRGIEVLPQFA